MWWISTKEIQHGTQSLHSIIHICCACVWFESAEWSNTSTRTFVCHWNVCICHAYMMTRWVSVFHICQCSGNVLFFFVWLLFLFIFPPSCWTLKNAWITGFCGFSKCCLSCFCFCIDHELNCKENSFFKKTTSSSASFTFLRYDADHVHGAVDVDIFF